MAVHKKSYSLRAAARRKVKPPKVLMTLPSPAGLTAPWPETNRLDRFDEFGKHVRLRDRNIVSSQHEFQFRGEGREALYGSNVGIEIGFPGGRKPDGGGIIRVAGEEQSILAGREDRWRSGVWTGCG